MQDSTDKEIKKYPLTLKKREEDFLKYSKQYNDWKQWTMYCIKADLESNDLSFDNHEIIFQILCDSVEIPTFDYDYYNYEFPVLRIVLLKINTDTLIALYEKYNSEIGDKENTVKYIDTEGVVVVFGNDKLVDLRKELLNIELVDSRAVMENYYKIMLGSESPLWDFEKKRFENGIEISIKDVLVIGGTIPTYKAYLQELTKDIWTENINIDIVFLNELKGIRDSLEKTMISFIQLGTGFFEDREAYTDYFTNKNSVIKLFGENAYDCKFSISKFWQLSNDTTTGLFLTDFGKSSHRWDIGRYHNFKSNDNECVYTTLNFLENLGSLLQVKRDSAVWLIDKLEKRLPTGNTPATAQPTNKKPKTEKLLPAFKEMFKDQKQFDNILLIIKPLLDEAGALKVKPEGRYLQALYNVLDERGYLKNNAYSKYDYEQITNALNNQFSTDLKNDNFKPSNRNLGDNHKFHFDNIPSIQS